MKIKKTKKEIRKWNKKELRKYIILLEKSIKSMEEADEAKDRMIKAYKNLYERLGTV